MSFEFGFEKLLAHKHTLEDIARRDWIEAQAKVDKAQAEIKAMYDAIEAARNRVGVLGSEGGALGPEMGSIDEFIKGQKIRIERKRADLRMLMGVAEEKHELLVQAAIERKTLEKLKERKFAEYKLLRKKRELKETDELVTTRFKAAGDK